MKTENLNKSDLSDRHVGWIVYQKMITKVKPSKKVYKRQVEKRKEY